MIFLRSENVPQLRHYQDYRDLYLRPDFLYRCAYCHTPELYFLQGDGGAIDHFRPVNPPSYLNADFSHLINAYSNLYWTCGRCNACKGNAWPSDKEIAEGRRFLDPCADDNDDHWEVLVDGRLSPLTSVGSYTIDAVRLNRPRLVWLRSYLQDCSKRISELEWILAAKEMDLETRAALSNQLETLRGFVDPLPLVID